MENQRVILWIALAFTAWLTWQAWVADYDAPPASVAESNSAQPLDVVDEDTLGDLPALR